MCKYSIYYCRYFNKKNNKASNEKGINQIAGGVSANSYLRTRLLELKEKYNKEVYIPKFEYCTDNGYDLVISGYYKFLEKIILINQLHQSPRLYMF